MLSEIDSFLTKLNNLFWFTIAPILGLLVLISAYIASQNPERYATYNYSFAITIGLLFLSLPFGKRLILSIYRRVTTNNETKKTVLLSKKDSEKEFINAITPEHFSEHTEPLEKKDISEKTTLEEFIVEEKQFYSSEITAEALTEFKEKLFSKNELLKQSKDIFKYTLTYSQTFKQRALDSENLLSFRKLLEKRDIIKDYTDQDIREIIESDLLKIYREDHAKKLRYKQNIRDSGII